MPNHTKAVPTPLWFLFIILVTFVSLPQTCLASNSANGRLLCGTARLNITPDLPVTLAGYAGRDGLSTGIHDSLFVRVIAFEHNDHRLVLIATDVIGFYNNTASIIQQNIIEKTGLKPSEIYLSAIHTHSAPSIVLDESKGHANNVKYTRYLNGRIITAIEQTLAHKQPVQLNSGSGSSPVGVNRRQVYYDETGNPRMWIGRNSEGVADKEVQVLEIKQASGNTVAVLFDYATHSTSLGWKNYVISGDIHGIAEQFVEEYLGDGVIAPAFVGASGDIDPWYRVLPGFKTDRNWVPEPVLMGTLLGEEVIHVLQDMDDSFADGPINSVFETLYLPGKSYGEMTVSESDTLTPLNISVARVGDIAFVGFGGEVLSEIGLAIKQASPFQQTFLITHCNGTSGYLVPKHRFNEQGYEVRSSPFAPDAADIVIKRIVKLLHQL